MPTTMTWMELTPTAFGRSENTQPLSLVMRENEGQQFSKLQHFLRKNDPIPWSFHLVWMSFPCLTPLTHRSVPWWFNSLKRGSFHGIYHHLLIIYSSFTHHLLVDPYSPYWFPGRVTPPATTSGGLFKSGQAHDSPWWWRIWPCAPGSRRASLKWDYRRLHASGWQHWDPWSNMIHDNKGWVWVVDICIIFNIIYIYIRI
jgi:hypothetical protein